MSRNVTLRIVVLVVVAIAAVTIIYIKVAGQDNKSSDQNAPVSQTENTAVQASSPGEYSLDKALRSGKPTMIVFHSNSCAPCKEMSAIVEAVKAEHEASANFIDILVDDPAEQNFINQFGVNSIPTSIFFDKTGKQLGTQIGVIEQEQLAEMLSDLEK